MLGTIVRLIVIVGWPWLGQDMVTVLVKMHRLVQKTVSKKGAAANKLAAFNLLVNIDRQSEREGPNVPEDIVLVFLR